LPLGCLVYQTLHVTLLANAHQVFRLATAASVHATDSRSGLPTPVYPRHGREFHTLTPSRKLHLRRRPRASQPSQPSHVTLWGRNRRSTKRAESTKTSRTGGCKGGPRSGRGCGCARVLSSPLWRLRRLCRVRLASEQHQTRCRNTLLVSAWPMTCPVPSCRGLLPPPPPPSPRRNWPSRATLGE
jgi:hypothetical protein